MIRRNITLSEFAARAAETLPKGVLLTSRVGDKINSMVIGWGTVGVNLPLSAPDPTVIAVCGGKSGREMEKLEACGLHPVPGEAVSVPAILEFPVTVECRILYRQEQEPAHLPEALRTRYYPQERDSAFAGSNRDAHVTYFGEILNAYILETEEGD